MDFKNPGIKSLDTFAKSIRFGLIRIGMPWMLIPIRVRQDDADPTRCESTTWKNTCLPVSFRGVGDKVLRNTITAEEWPVWVRRLGEAHRVTHIFVRYKLKSENKKLLFVPCCTKNCAVPGTVPVPTYRDGRIYSTQTARNSVCVHGSMWKGTSLRAESDRQTSSGSLLMKIFCKAGTRRQTECNLYKVF